MEKNYLLPVSLDSTSTDGLKTKAYFSFVDYYGVKDNPAPAKIEDLTTVEDIKLQGMAELVEALKTLEDADERSLEKHLAFNHDEWARTYAASCIYYILEHNMPQAIVAAAARIKEEQTRPEVGQKWRSKSIRSNVVVAHIDEADRVFLFKASVYDAAYCTMSDFKKKYEYTGKTVDVTGLLAALKETDE